MTSPDSNPTTNLDTVCAEYGYKIVQQSSSSVKTKTDKSKLENTITKSLGVLQEDGVYAFFLFLAYFEGRGENLGAEKIAAQTKAMLRHSSVELLKSMNDDFAAIRELTNDLDRLLLTRQLLEQALIYARYHAKALPDPKKAAPNAG